MAEWPKADDSLIDEQAERAEDLLERTIDDVQEIINVTGAQPAKITLYTTPQWKKEMLRLALSTAQASGGRLDMGALMKEAMASPAIAAHKKDAPKYAQKLAKAAHSLSAEALELDEYETLFREGYIWLQAWACRWRSFRRRSQEQTPRGKAVRRSREGRRYISSERADGGGEVAPPLRQSSGLMAWSSLMGRSRVGGNACVS
nr:hypothetical protein [Methanothrix sp.]